jgi:lipopolysaccharide export system permease protein
MERTDPFHLLQALLRRRAISISSLSPFRCPRPLSPLSSGVRLLDRFLLRELAIPLAYCLAGFLMFWISFDLFTALDDFQRDHLWARDIAEYYWVRLPELLVVVLPIALLLAMLYALANHSRHHEITAMRSAGISLWRICVPYFFVGAAFCAIVFYLNEDLAPNASDRIEQIQKRRTPQNVDPQIVQNLNFRNAQDDRFWNIPAFNPATGELTNPQIKWTMPDGVVRTLIAKSAIHTNGAWQFSHVQILAYPPPSSTNFIPTIRTNQFTVREWTETPADIRLQIRFSKLNAVNASKRPQLSLQEIAYLKTHLELNTRDAAILETQRQGRLAQPWTSLVVALIAIPFGAASGRRNVFIGVALSIFLCFGYFILQRFGLALASGGYINAALGAWLPNALFAASGLWLTHRVK